VVAQAVVNSQQPKQWKREKISDHLWLLDCKLISMTLRNNYVIGATTHANQRVCIDVRNIQSFSGPGYNGLLAFMVFW